MYAIGIDRVTGFGFVVVVSCAKKITAIIADLRLRLIKDSGDRKKFFASVLDTIPKEQEPLQGIHQ